MDKRLTELSLKFFEGKTTAEEESLLFSEISRSGETATEFRLLEEKWKTTHTPSRKTVGVWAVTAPPAFFQTLKIRKESYYVQT